jgi:hypothetical protein
MTFFLTLFLNRPFHASERNSTVAVIFGAEYCCRQAA